MDCIYRDMEEAGLPEPRYRQSDFMLYAELRNILTMIPAVSKNILLCYVIDTNKFEHIRQMKQILVSFPGKFDVVYKNNMPMEHTTELMNNENLQRKIVVEFIRNAELYLDNYEYVNIEDIRVNLGSGGENRRKTYLICRKILWTR